MYFAFNLAEEIVCHNTSFEKSSLCNVDFALVSHLCHFLLILIDHDNKKEF